MSSPDPRQIDGLGGSHPLTSKVALVSRCSEDGVDIDFLFAQIGVETETVDAGPNCGNILSGVGIFALDRGLARATDPMTRLKIRTINTGTLCEVCMQTPGVRWSTKERAELPVIAAGWERDVLATMTNLIRLAILESADDQLHEYGLEMLSRRITTYISRHLHDPDLSIDEIASHFVAQNATCIKLLKIKTSRSPTTFGSFDWNAARKTWQTGKVRRIHTGDCPWVGL